MILEPLQKLIAGLLLLIVVFLSGFYIGHKQEKEKYDAYKSQMVAMAVAQEQTTKDMVQKQQQVTQETINDYKAQLANIRAYYGRMLNTTNSTNQVPTIPNPTFRIDDGSSYTLLIGKCAETTFQLETLQSWLKTQQIINDNR